MSRGTDDPALLRVRALGLLAAGVPTALVSDLSFDVAKGETIGVVGESGSGKTLTGRAILGLLPPGVKRIAGSIVFDGEELTVLSSARMRAMRGPGIGMVFQEPMTSLNPAIRIGEQLEEGLRYHARLPAAQIRARALEMLERVRISDPMRCFSAYPHEFSGGMRQRIMLAAVMLMRPKLLIADEPTTALDTLSQKEVLDLTAELARDFGSSVMLITHDLGLVSRYTQRLLVMCKGRLVESGATHAVLRAPQEAYTQALVAAQPRPAQARVLAPETQSKPLIEARDIGVRFVGRNGQPAVQAVAGAGLIVNEGETVALVGGSGSGKTTLGRAIVGLGPVTSGVILFRGQDLRLARPAQRRDHRLSTQIVFQDPSSALDPRMRVAALVDEPLRHRPDLSRADRARRVAELIDAVGLTGFERRFANEMSGGQRQRVAIARALVGYPSLVVADEPVSALDTTVQAQVLALFRSLQCSYGFACLFISHDLAVVQQIADRVVVMSGGAVVEAGSCDEVLSRPRHPYTQALVEATPGLVGI
jgi:peptide/nickel transport system ATP-binding protein